MSLLVINDKKIDGKYVMWFHIPSEGTHRILLFAEEHKVCLKAIKILFFSFWVISAIAL